MKNEEATTNKYKEAEWQSGRVVEGKKAESAHCKLYSMREFLEIVKPFIKF